MHLSDWRYEISWSMMSVIGAAFFFLETWESVVVRSSAAYLSPILCTASFAHRLSLRPPKPQSIPFVLPTSPSIPATLAVAILHATANALNALSAL